MTNKLTNLSVSALACSLALLTGCSSSNVNASGQESVGSIIKQGIAVGKMGSHVLKAVDNECQQQLKTNPQYKNKLSTLGGAYKQRSIRFHICDSVTDMAMDTITDEQLEKAVHDISYQRLLINNTVSRYLPVSFNKVVNKR